MKTETAPVQEQAECLTRAVLWRCTDCGETCTDATMLKAANPFGGHGEVMGCPHCKEVPEFINMCDEPGCRQQAGCGWPSPSGYRRTCGAHRKL
jgi:hypothetical protein